MLASNHIKIRVLAVTLATQIYGPVWLASTSLVTTSYNAINCDEAQDVTMLKILFIEKAAFDSDRIAHTH